MLSRSFFFHLFNCLLAIYLHVFLGSGGHCMSLNCLCSCDWVLVHVECMHSKYNSLTSIISLYSFSVCVRVHVCLCIWVQVQGSLCGGQGTTSLLCLKQGLIIVHCCGVRLGGPIAVWIFLYRYAGITDACIHICFMLLLEIQTPVVRPVPVSTLPREPFSLVFLWLFPTVLPALFHQCGISFWAFRSSYIFNIFTLGSPPLIYLIYSLL